MASPKGPTVPANASTPRLGEVSADGDGRVDRETRELFATLERIAPTGRSVLVEGETRICKVEIALALHKRGPRSGGPFVAVDAAAVGGLTEPLLFGDEGALDGASRVGAVEVADGGTLFIDEIGELPLELQSKLLRALESRTFTRVAGKASIPVDLSVIAATRRDLRADVDSHRFREDLYRYLAQAHVVLPPLRTRASAIFPRVTHLLPGFEGDVAAESIPPEPDTRELEGTFVEAKSRAVGRFERAYLEALLQRCGGNLSEAARQAAIARNYLRRLLKKRGLYPSNG